MNSKRSKLQILVAPLNELKEIDREVFRIRFDSYHSPVRDDEVRLYPMVIFRGETLEIVSKDACGKSPLFNTAHEEISDHCLKTLENPPMVQPDGYYHLTVVQLSFMLVYFATATMISHQYQTLQSIAMQVDKVSVALIDYANFGTLTWFKPLCVIYTVTDAEIKAAVSDVGNKITVELIRH